VGKVTTSDGAPTPPNDPAKRPRTPAQHAFEQWGYLMARGDFDGARAALRKARGGLRGQAEGHW